MYTDDFVLNQRTNEQDQEIIKSQIDKCLPLVDPMKEAADKKERQKEKNKQNKKGGKSLVPSPRLQHSSQKGSMVDKRSATSEKSSS